MKRQIIKATSKDSALVKMLINEMYGIEYEMRSDDEIGERIENNDEIYLLSFIDDECIGFAGATKNYQEYKDKYGYGTVIDYIYVKQQFRGVQTAYEMIKLLIELLIQQGFEKAIMQVQTFNKQRFFHYALSDKNIIHSEKCERNDTQYEDQILLIKDLQKVKNLTLKELIAKSYEFRFKDMV